RGLRHGIGCFDASGVALGFYHAYCFAHVFCWLMFVNLNSENYLISSQRVSCCRLPALPSSVSMCTSSLKLLSTRTSILSSVMAQGPPILSFMSSPALTP